MRIITLEEALNQGSTASELRVLANCLDRISNMKPDFMPNGDLPINYDREENRRNAAALRRLARDVQKVGSLDKKLAEAEFLKHSWQKYV